MMRNRISTAALLITVPALVAAQAPIKVDAISFSPAANLATLEADDLKGQPARLSWSADGKQLHLQTLDGKFGQADARLQHYLIDAATGSKKKVDTEPDWAAAYWTEKSWKAAPGAPAFQIDLKTEQRVEKTVSAPMGGDLARGGGVGGDGGSSTTGDVLAAAYNQQPVPVHTMRLAGETVGEFVNSVIVPGLTFGWGPKGTSVVAFSANKSGRVIVMDDKGTKKEVAGSKDALLPAWSPDGTRIVWLEKDGKKKFQLRMVTIN